MLSGLFKRKDKKSRSQDEDMDESEKVSEEISRLSPQPKLSSDSLSQDVPPTKPAQLTPQRHPSKLQKAPPGNLSPTKIDQAWPNPMSTPTKPLIQAQPPPDRPAPLVGPVSSSMRVVSPDVDHREEDTPAPLRVRSPEQPREGAHMDSRQEPKQLTGVFSPATGVLASSPLSSNAKPESNTKEKQRAAMADFNPSPEMEEQSESPEEPQPASRAHPSQSSQSINDRLSESPIQVSPVDPPASQPPPALIVDTSSPEEPSISSASSPELIETNEAEPDQETPASTTQAPSVTPPTWSNANLRTYLEDDSEIRDLLVVVHDKTGVLPAGPDHPITGGLFKEENRKLGELSTRLDGILGEWLARKSKGVA